MLLGIYRKDSDADLSLRLLVVAVNANPDAGGLHLFFFEQALDPKPCSGGCRPFGTLAGLGGRRPFNWWEHPAGQRRVPDLRQRATAQLKLGCCQGNPFYLLYTHSNVT